MATVIDVRELEEEDVRLVESLVERLKRKAAKKKPGKIGSNEATPEIDDVLDVTAGAWKNMIDCEDLKRRIYENRLVSTRAEVRL